jgi:hypothetical protein
MKDYSPKKTKNLGGNSKDAPQQRQKSTVRATNLIKKKAGMA